MNVCKNTVTTVAIAAVCIMGTVSVWTNHDQLELSLGTIALLAGVTQIPRKSDPVNSITVPTNNTSVVVSTPPAL